MDPAGWQTTDGRVIDHLGVDSLICQSRRFLLGGTSLQHNIQLDGKERVLIIEEPDNQGYWSFLLQEYGQVTVRLTRFLNQSVMEPTGVYSTSWHQDLSGRLSNLLYNLVSSSFLDRDWKTKIFPQVKKIVEQYNMASRIG